MVWTKGLGSAFGNGNERGMGNMSGGVFFFSNIIICKRKDIDSISTYLLFFFIFFFQIYYSVRQMSAYSLSRYLAKSGL